MPGPIIGLEVHVQVTGARTKLFCGCSSSYWDKPPNTNVCPVCLGMPGALPVVNQRVIELAAYASTAFNCSVPEWLVFTRKHYFYPDLPKNYQITQYKSVAGLPICNGGIIPYIDPGDWELKTLGLERINIEEDPGRTVYLRGGITGSPVALVDYNRSGMPLLEIVTRPEIRSAREARVVVENILLTLWYLGVTDPRLPGSFRVDANISVPGGGGRVEVKNIGSLAELERALLYETLRQSKIVAAGGRIKRETRHWDPVKGVSRPTREKEFEADYMYFPDPDLPPVRVTRSLREKAEAAARMTHIALYNSILRGGVKPELAWSIVQDKPLGDLYRDTIALHPDPPLVAHLIGNVVKGLHKTKHLPHLPSPADLARLAEMVSTGKLLMETVKNVVLPEMMSEGLSLRKALEKTGVLAVRVDPEELVERVVKENPGAVSDYLSGKAEALNYLVGQAMKASRGTVDPRRVRKLLLERLSKKGVNE